MICRYPFDTSFAVLGQLSQNNNNTFSSFKSVEATRALILTHRILYKESIISNYHPIYHLKAEARAIETVRYGYWWESDITPLHSYGKWCRIHSGSIISLCSGIANRWLCWKECSNKRVTGRRTDAVWGSQTAVDASITTNSSLRAFCCALCCELDSIGHPPCSLNSLLECIKTNTG